MNNIAALIVTYAEAAAILHISPRTVSQYVYDGILIPLKRPGMRPVFRRDYIEAKALGLHFDKKAASEVPVHYTAVTSSDNSSSVDTNMISQRGIGVKREDC